MTITERIDSILRDKKMSRRKLAINAGISPSTLQSAMEKGGDMPFSKICAIANALGVEVSIFNFLESEP